MNPDLLLILLVSIIVFLSIYLKTNISLALLVACAGYVVADLTALSLSNTLILLGLDVSYDTLHSLLAATLTTVPSLIVLYRFRNYQPDRFLEHIAPAVGYALLLPLLSLSWLPIDLKLELSKESYLYSQLEFFQTYVVIAAVIIAVFDVTAHEQRLRKKSKRKRKKTSSDV